MGIWYKTAEKSRRWPDAEKQGRVTSTAKNWWDCRIVYYHPDGGWDFLDVWAYFGSSEGARRFTKRKLNRQRRIDQKYKRAQIPSTFVVH